MTETELKDWLKNNLIVELESDRHYITLKIRFAGEKDNLKYYSIQKFFIEQTVSHFHD